MTNYSSKILNNAVSSLQAQQALIAVTSTNIGNVNTEGYARRGIELEARGSGTFSGDDLGSGVQAGKVRQTTDSYLERLLREAAGDKAGAGVSERLLSRAESYFDLTGKSDTVGSAVTAFFTAVNDLTSSPSGIELRTNLLQKAQALADAVRTTYQGLAALQDEADRTLDSEIASVNDITRQIAVLNGAVVTGGAAGTVAADARDKRELLMQELSEKISFERVDQSDGSSYLYLPGGLPLVAGTKATPLTVTPTPSFVTGPTPPLLSGAPTRYVVFDYDTTAAEEHVDLTSILRGGSGTVGGLLKFRGHAPAGATSAFASDGTVVDLAKRVESIARSFLVDVNNTYLGSDGDTTTAGFQPGSRDLDGNPPASPFALFSAATTAVLDADGDGRPSHADLAAASVNIDSYAARLTVGVTDPRKIAAALEIDPATAGVQAAPGDARNMAAVAGLATTAINHRVLARGSGTVLHSFTSTFDEAYNEAVTLVGNRKAAAKTERVVAEGNYEAAATRRDEVSAVSLDEEFTNLIRYQKGYEASARMIKVADELLQTLLNAL